MAIATKYPHVALKYELKQKNARDMTALQVTSQSIAPVAKDNQITVHFQLAEWQHTEFNNVVANPRTFSSKVEIKELAEYVGNQIGVPPFKIALFFQKDHNDDAIGFWSYNRRIKLCDFLEVEPIMNLILVVKPNSTNANTEVRVAIPRQTITIYANLHTTTIQDLKNIIAWKVCIPPNFQHLFVPGQGELENERVMSSYAPKSLCNLTLGVFPISS